MKRMFKMRLGLLSIWVIVTILFAFNQPDINKVIDVKGQATISESSQSNCCN